MACAPLPATETRFFGVLSPPGPAADFLGLLPAGLVVGPPTLEFRLYFFITLV
jgi:hypothetical protein